MLQKREDVVVNGSDLQGFGSILQITILPRKFHAYSFLHSRTFEPIEIDS
jgi:hypothetical protein